MLFHIQKGRERWLTCNFRRDSFARLITCREKFPQSHFLVVMSTLHALQSLSLPWWHNPDLPLCDSRPHDCLSAPLVEDTRMQLKHLEADLTGTVMTVSLTQQTLCNNLEEEMLSVEVYHLHFLPCSCFDTMSLYRLFSAQFAVVYTMLAHTQILG